MEGGREDMRSTKYNTFALLFFERSVTLLELIVCLGLLGGGGAVFVDFALVA